MTRTKISPVPPSILSPISRIISQIGAPEAAAAE
jgi:hypothetical protein